VSALTDGRHDEPMFAVVAEGVSDGETVEITRAFPVAQKIKAEDLRVTDLLFDTTGGTHGLRNLRVTRGWIHTVREDGWPDTFHHDDVVTIIRPTEEV